MTKNVNETVDLTAITTPFGLLDEAMQGALMAHGGPYEVFDTFGWVDLAEDAPWINQCTYRVRPAPVEPPKPREWWVREHTNGEIGVYATKEEAWADAIFSTKKVFTVREVLE